MGVVIQKGKKPNEFAEHLDATAILATSSVTKKKGKDPEKLISEASETLHPGVLIPADQLYLLTVEGSHTVNLGNYESARIGVNLRVPTTKGELDEAYAWATGWVSAKIEAAVSDAKGS